MSQVERLYVRDESSGRWHIATVVGDEEPRYFDGCNVIGTRELFHELPEDVDESLKCRRCFGKDAGDA